MPYVMSGDIGGTKALLAIYDSEQLKANNRASPVYEKNLPSGRYDSLSHLVNSFLEGWDKEKPSACCLGIPGPVNDGKAYVTNLDWEVTEVEVAHETGIPKVRFINDFAAVGYSTHVLLPDDFLTFDHWSGVVHKSDSVPCTKKGVTAYLGAGTGLGAGFIVEGNVYPSEGGHISFSPIEGEDIEYMRFVRAKYNSDHVSFERMVSGLGLHDLHDFYWQRLHSLAGPAIRQHVLETEGRIDIEFFAKCAETGDRYALKIFRKFFYYYGLFISDMVVVFRPKNLFIAGGILAKNINLFTGSCLDEFKRGFLCKGRMRGFSETTPIHIMMNPNVGLMGATYYASSML
ncbi:Glucokinase [Giardia muris]|uniref:Glucokinase n=1 Tax=Giardia muris TaxID=5742 RepID=A0A4Z1SNS8_GIAMU|nr:Glucokinase [Giardia muris]|eukprot:TNJ27436.1 Glucokinase [Giardia muris]